MLSAEGPSVEKRTRRRMKGEEERTRAARGEDESTRSLMGEEVRE